MKALIYTGPETLALAVAKPPTPASGEVLIEVEAAGICGSDMHAYLGHDERRPAPLILGHEAAGTIVKGPRKGERVTINPLVTCGRCRYCLDGRDNLCIERQIISMPPREGAFAEMIAMPERNLVPVPDGVPPSKAALTEPLACGWHAVKLAERALTRPLSETRCLVLGGGAIGLGAALALAVNGAADIRITDANPERRKALTAAGPFEVRDAGMPASPAELVVDAVGIAATRSAAFETVTPGGVIMHIGLGSAEGGLNARRATLQEITFIGTYTYTAQDFRDTAAAIFDGRLGSLDWTEERALSDGPAAFRDLLEGKVAAPKIVLHP